MVEITTIVIYMIRLFQTVRIAIGNGKFLFTREMFRIIRAIISIAMAALSIAARKNQWALLWVWLALAIISACYSFVIDVLFDWNLYMIEYDTNGKLIFIRR